LFYGKNNATTDQSTSKQEKDFTTNKPNKTNKEINISELFNNSSPWTWNSIIEKIQNDEFRNFFWEIEKLDIDINQNDFPKEIVDLYRYGELKFNKSSFDGDQTSIETKESRRTRKDFSSRRETFETQRQGQSIDAVWDRKYHSEDRAWQDNGSDEDSYDESLNQEYDD